MLEVRLNKRIDQMVQRGLLEELITLHTLCKQHSLPSDVLSHGIFQAIGTQLPNTQTSRLQGIHSLSGPGRKQRHSTGAQYTRPMH